MSEWGSAPKYVQTNIYVDNIFYTDCNQITFIKYNEKGQKYDIAKNISTIYTELSNLGKNVTMAWISSHRGKSNENPQHTVNDYCQEISFSGFNWKKKGIIMARLRIGHIKITHERLIKKTCLLQ